MRRTASLFHPDSDLLLGVAVLNLVTRLGELDLVLLPAGGLDYGQLHEDSVAVQLGGLTVELASLDDVIWSKTAAARPKDRAALPVLRALLDRLHDMEPRG